MTLNIRTEECPSFDALKADGYDVRKLYLGDYYDGVTATKIINGKRLYALRINANAGR
jgi:hypothetical protein